MGCCDVYIMRAQLVDGFLKQEKSPTSIFHLFLEMSHLLDDCFYVLKLYGFINVSLLPIKDLFHLWAVKLGCFKC